MDYTAWAECYDLIYSLAPSGDIDFYVGLARQGLEQPSSSHPSLRASGRPESWRARIEGPRSSFSLRGKTARSDSRNSAQSTVLELGAGTGRIAIPTALAGANITAIDLQPEMLDRAEAKAFACGLTVIRNGRRPIPRHKRSPRSHPPATVELIEADMRALDLGRTFPLITIPSNTLLLTTTKRDQLSTLKHAAAHLPPGGILAFDIFNPTPELLSDRRETPFLWGETTNPENGRTCRIYAVNRFDTRRQLNRGTQIIEEIPCDPPSPRVPSGRESARMRVEVPGPVDFRGRVARRVELDILIRYLHPSEAHLLIESAGLAVTGLYGDFDLSPFMASSPRMIFICALRR